MIIGNEVRQHRRKVIFKQECLLVKPWHRRWGTLRCSDLQQDATGLGERLLPSRNGLLFATGDHHVPSMFIESGQNPLQFMPKKKKSFKIQFLMLYWLYCLQFSPDNACIVTGLCQCFLCASQGLKVGSTKCHSRQSIAVICFPSCVNLVFNYTLGCAIRASFAISMEFAAAMRIRYIWLKMCWKREGERSIEPLYFILIVLNFNLSVGMSWKLRVRGWKNLV